LPQPGHLGARCITGTAGTNVWCPPGTWVLVASPAPQAPMCGAPTDCCCLDEQRKCAHAAAHLPCCLLPAGIDWSQGGEGLALESALAAQEAAAASPGSSSGRRSDATGDAGQARPQQQRTYQEQRQLAIQQLQRELPGASLAPAGSGDPLVQQGRGQQEGRLQDGAAWSSGGGRLQEGAAGSSGGGQPWRQLEPGDYWLAAESSTRWVAASGVGPGGAGSWCVAVAHDDSCCWARMCNSEISQPRV